MIIFYIFAITLFFIMSYIVLTYNKIITIKNFLNEAVSTMDIYLKKRFDLIPNIVSVTKYYAEYEKDTLESVVNSRNYESMNTDEKIKNYNNLNKIIMISEAYPNLKADTQYMKLIDELTKIENDIASSRKYYNGMARRLNDILDMFPSNIIGNLFKFKKPEMFNTMDRSNVEIKL